jgi:hypothetical protein
MWKIGRQFLTQNKNDSGFTLIEAITMVAVLSVLGVVLWSGASLALRAVTDINSRLDSTSKFLKAEHLIRDKCRSVKFPYWLKESVSESDENSLKIYYYQGNKESTLTFSFKDNLLWITEHLGNLDQESQELKEPCGPFAKSEFSLAENPTRGVYGIKIALWPSKEEAEAKKSEPEDYTPESAVYIDAEFGGIPLRNTTGEQE